MHMVCPPVDVCRYLPRVRRFPISIVIALLGVRMTKPFVHNPSDLYLFPNRDGKLAPVELPERHALRLLLDGHRLAV